MKSRINSYIEQFSQLFNGHPWLDESFSKKLDPLSIEEVFLQTPNGNHSVAEVVSHITEWRKEILRRLNRNSSETILSEESSNDWIPIEVLRISGWKQLYTDFKASQQDLIHLLEIKTDNFLDESLPGTEFDKEYFVAGLLHHDCYHLGQIGLIIKLVSVPV